MTRPLLILLFVSLTACGEDPRRGSGTDAGGGMDAARDGPIDIPGCFPGCGDEELCGEGGEGNGSDDDCDDAIDETCSCPAINLARSCFPGPPERRNVGTCADGVMYCTEFLIWGSCVGGQGPAAEQCDGADNDCDGTTDNGLTDCETPIQCPGTQGAAPLNVYALRGSEIYEGPTRSQQWTITCPPSIDTCPTPRDARAVNTDIYFAQSGSYRARYSLVTDAGEELSCEWIIVVEGAGLRVEMAWDTQGDGFGDTDVDLHLHRHSLDEGQREGETDFFSADDCYYHNCKATSYTAELKARWAIGDTTDLAACQNAPHEQGTQWMERGACYNPRLDVDVVSCEPSISEPTNPSFCAAENINVDNPPLGSPFRIMVNYFTDHGHEGDTHAVVNVYCGGELRGRFGGEDGMPLRMGASFGEDNDSWLVADVVLYRDECGRIQCQLQPIDIIQTGAGFGPPWSF